MTLVKMVGYMTLDELISTSYEIAKSKGWWGKPRSFAALTLLMQSEISEALEDYRAGKGLSEVWYAADGKVCGIPSELADTIIRIADFCGHFNLPLYAIQKSRLERVSDDFEIGLAEANACISAAYRDLSKIPKIADLWQAGSFGTAVSWSLTQAVQHIFYMCEANDINIWKAIEEKTAFNRTRPERHGGKAI